MNRWDIVLESIVARPVVKQNLFINISNIGYGFCVNDIRLLLKVKQISTQNFIVLKTSAHIFYNKNIAAEGVDCLVGFAWPTRQLELNQIFMALRFFEQVTRHENHHATDFERQVGWQIAEIAGSGLIPQPRLRLPR